MDDENVGDSQDNTQLEIYDQKQQLRAGSPSPFGSPPSSARRDDSSNPHGPSSIPHSHMKQKRARSPGSAVITEGSSKRSHIILNRIKGEVTREVEASVSEDLRRLKPLLERFHRKMFSDELRIILGGEEEGNMAEEERVVAIEQLLNDIRVMLT
jgi:hypothetical protein